PAGDSADGISDLAGNVREWTASRDGRFRIVRGGSWGDSLPDFVAVAFRGMNAPDERFELTGFRCAADPAASGTHAIARAEEPARRSEPSATTTPTVPVLRADELLFVVRPRR
ncbi:MAG TPA: SUMF1/EgtB/PvdO family nonheme iron enzyme, partial [Anaeromyxobacteraceae bacterium]|nr:SUMF1/EgtB/PvdO family nonheme iron enzyme [Anaeromyxobacteraceae bacterium]